MVTVAEKLSFQTGTNIREASNFVLGHIDGQKKKKRKTPDRQSNREALQLYQQ